MPNKIYIKSIQLLIILTIIWDVFVRAGDVRLSEWVYPGPDGRLVYKKTPAGDRIMDFSSAGYMGGGVSLPVVPVKKMVQPSGGSDDTAIIQAAIDEISSLPVENGFRGAVLLAPGTYPCADEISISADGVVLRGEPRMTTNEFSGNHEITRMGTNKEFKKGISLESRRVFRNPPLSTNKHERKRFLILRRGDFYAVLE